MYRSSPSATRRGYIGGPMREQSFVCHDDASPNWGVSYGAHFKSTRPHCVALIVNKAICGPKYNTNVCRPEPVHQHSTTYNHADIQHTSVKGSQIKQTSTEKHKIMFALESNPPSKPGKRQRGST